jgi:uncharacterized protein YfbU (UPF0304 family)
LNQFKILRHVDPKDGKYYEHSQHVLERGYEIEYEWIAQDVYADDDTLPVSETAEALDILEMYAHMQQSFDDLEDTSEIDARRISFPGWDGNHQPKLVGFCRYFHHVRGRYQFLRRPADWDSRFPVMDAYRRMLEVWRPIRQKRASEVDQNLTNREIREILLASPDPESTIGRLRDAKPPTESVQ